MADYPSFIQLWEGTEDDPSGVREIDMAQSGKPRVRVVSYIEDQGIINLAHDLTDSELSELVSHYRAHAALSFNTFLQRRATDVLTRYRAVPVYRHDRINSWFVTTQLIEVSA